MMPFRLLPLILFTAMYAGLPAQTHNLVPDSGFEKTRGCAAEVGDFDKARIRMKGYGSSNPLDTNITEEGRSNNRRVEIIFN